MFRQKIEPIPFVVAPHKESQITKENINCLRFDMCPLQAPHFLLWPLTVIMRQTRQAVQVINQSIFFRCLSKEPRLIDICVDYFFIWPKASSSIVTNRTFSGYFGVETKIEAISFFPCQQSSG